ncbi:hypothetical protein L6452_38695 [Arctium lappa]|uniref:Uncharacterized protein n=1 Tax=Arctium lappa TaxID=4217 RepID=A0ACB8XPT4_ARCLA|nr:hypothetical protein L6452_38695 [Arctium lappa]
MYASFEVRDRCIDLEVEGGVCCLSRFKNTFSTPILIDFDTEDEDAPPENNDLSVNEAPYHNPVNVVEVIVNHPKDPMREPEDRLPEQQASQEGSLIKMVCFSTSREQPVDKTQKNSSRDSHGLSRTAKMDVFLMEGSTF